jgi:aminopeptidase-like protein
MIEHSSDSRALELGRQMHALAAELYPICRSVTGPGVRQTLAHLAKMIPLETYEVPSGTKVFDWEVPREWTIRDAYIKDETGRRVVDFQQLNLHVVGYSIQCVTMSWSGVKPQLHFYRTTRTGYYRIGFSKEIGDSALATSSGVDAAGERSYDVCIDSSLQPTRSHMGRFFQGQTDDSAEFRICHPSRPTITFGHIRRDFLLKSYNGASRYSYRFLFIPATFGAAAVVSESGSWTASNTVGASGWAMQGPKRTAAARSVGRHSRACCGMLESRRH